MQARRYLVEWSGFEMRRTPQGVVYSRVVWAYDATDALAQVRTPVKESERSRTDGRGNPEETFGGFQVSALPGQQGCVCPIDMPQPDYVWDCSRHGWCGRRG